MAKGCRGFMHRFLRTGLFAAALLVAELPAWGAETPTPAVAAAEPSLLTSPEDGWLDCSGFLDTAYGFIPVVMPITEPAVGYGGGLGLLFVDKQRKDAQQAGFGRPNISAVGGFATENGTWGVAAGDMRHWQDDRLQTLVGAGYASVNLDFYGIGEDSVLKDHPLSYNLEPLGGLVQARYRLGNSRAWAGLGYALISTEVSFDAPTGTTGIPEHRSTSRVGGVTPALSFDSRDNFFTPTRGSYVEGMVGLHSQALGGDDEFQRATLTAMHYLPLHRSVTLGLRGDAAACFGDAPFYMLPYVSLRGAPAMRYQGEEMAQAELELRWQFWQRFSVVGFAGSGLVWNDLERLDDKRSVVTGGGGFRYELARKYGLHMGLDVAFGPDATAIYVQVGSAWMRP